MEESYEIDQRKKKDTKRIICTVPLGLGEIKENNTIYTNTANKTP